LNEQNLSKNYQIKLKVFRNNFSKIIDLERKTEFYYEGKIQLSDTGEYNYSGELVTDGNILENQTGKLIVGDSRIEYKKTSADESYLKQLSKNKGIVLNSVNKENIKEVINNISTNYSDTKEIKNKMFLNENIYLLIFIIVLFSIEWYLRKKKSLP
jgi:hypothetical protein